MTPLLIGKRGARASPATRERRAARWMNPCPDRGIPHRWSRRRTEGMTGDRRAGVNRTMRLVGFIDNEGGTGPTHTNWLIFFDEKNRFELSRICSMLSAEVLRKDNLGTVYKAVLEGNGGTVAVKRLKDISSMHGKSLLRDGIVNSISPYTPPLII
ncbi:leucine-rich repeat protein kinase family protein [Striga asiatica]|uniref:Leucine-rich repeat protein kinase family protein n=1 Tax=Striga asiatica TaxID=4170 RepID=A0A5A7PA53_STRAF|nr:leucine-rich repeat protein kinase family protein [Striga asiatica]